MPSNPRKMEFTVKVEPHPDLSANDLRRLAVELDLIEKMGKVGDHLAMMDTMHALESIEHDLNRDCDCEGCLAVQDIKDLYA